MTRNLLVNILPVLLTVKLLIVPFGNVSELMQGSQLGKSFYLTLSSLNKAEQHLNNTILYTCLGNNDKALGKNAEAEQAYLQAWNMAPARFYPLYLLAKLYDETGQHEKAVAMAKKSDGEGVKD